MSVNFNVKSKFCRVAVEIYCHSYKKDMIVMLRKAEKTNIFDYKTEIGQNPYFSAFSQ